MGKAAYVSMMLILYVRNHTAEQPAGCQTKPQQSLLTVRATVDERFGLD